MCKRNRAWRRHQNDRIIEKRLKIARECWFSGSSWDGKHDHFKQWLDQWPKGHLKKHNFTCDCKMCKIERYCYKQDRKQKEEKLKRCLDEEYGKVICF